MAKKRKRCSSRKVDRLSDLPVPLPHHILSFIPTEDVVRTCILAKGWRNIWRSIPSLDFDQSSTTRGQKSFFKFIDTVLQHRDETDIETFQMYLNCKLSDSRPIECWIRYAVEHNVLDVKILSFNPDGLPPDIFSCATLRELTLYSVFTPLCLPLAISVPKLKILELHSIVFQEEQLRLFSSLPSLETLIIEDCYFFYCYHLTISAPHVKNLKLTRTSLPEIFAPNLISLQICMQSSVHIIFNGYSLSMPNVYLDLPLNSYESMIKLFKLLNSAQSLALSAVFLSSIVRLVQKDLSLLKCIKTPFYNLTSLEIETFFSDAEILVINTFIKHSPEIETIVLKNKVGGDCSGISSTAEHFEAEQVLFKFKLAHLKLVEFQGFRGSDNEVKLAKVILQKVISLDNMIITTSQSEEGSLTDKQDMAKIGRELLEHRRYSGVGILLVL